MFEVSYFVQERLPEACGLRVNSVTTGGSLGLPMLCTGRLDAEIILYSQGEGRGGGGRGIKTSAALSTDIDPEDVDKKGYGEWLLKLHQFFQSDESLSKYYQFHALTETSLECVVDGVEVDLMVSPHWPVPANFYTFLTTLKPYSRTKSAKQQNYRTIG